MGLKDKRKEQGFGNRVQSPADIYLTWNPTRGVFSYSLPEKDGQEREMGDMKNLRFVILEPRLYKITGRNDNERIYSNLCMRFRHDLMQVWRRPFNGKPQKLNDKPAPYGDIRTLVNGAQGRYTKVIAVHLLSAKKAIYDPDKGKSGRWSKNQKMDHLAFMNLTGNAIIKGWGASLDEHEIGDDKDTCGMAVKQDKTVETQGRDRSKTYSQPVFEFTDLEDGSDILAAAEEKAKIVDAYLDEYFDEPDHFKDDEEVEEDKYEPAEADDEEDLPF